MYKENILLGALHIAISIIYIVISAAICAILYSFDFFDGKETPPQIIHVAGAVLSFFLFLISLCGITSGVGTMHNNQFSNIITLILGCIDLIFIPVGTAVGIYTIWVFMKNDISRSKRYQDKKERIIAENELPDYHHISSPITDSISSSKEECSE